VGYREVFLSYRGEKVVKMLDLTKEKPYFLGRALTEKQAAKN